MKNPRAVVSEYERLKITERMKRGRRQRARQGSVVSAGRPPYGYRSVELEGKTVSEIVEEEARVVRLVFSRYTEGYATGELYSLADITRELTEMRIPTRGDTSPQLHACKRRGWGEWSRASVHRMLRNETYAGIWHYGKSTGGSTNKHKRAARENRIAVQVPAIVSLDTWTAAQQRLEANRRNAAHRRKKQQYLAGVG